MGAHGFWARIAFVLALPTVLSACPLLATSPCGGAREYTLDLFWSGLVWHPESAADKARLTTTTENGRMHYLWSFTLDDACAAEPVTTSFQAHLHSQLAALGVAAEGRARRAAGGESSVALAPVDNVPGTSVQRWLSSASIELAAADGAGSEPAPAEVVLDISMNAALTTQQIKDNDFIPALAMTMDYHWTTAGD